MPDSGDAPAAGQGLQAGQQSTCRSPGRVNVIGEHTDYNGGFCLPIAIEQGCTAIVSITADDAVELVSAQLPGPIEIAAADLAPGVLTGERSWAAYPAGVVWALRQRGYQLPGLSISVDGDVPAGAGLSSSAALECAVAGAINDLLGLGLSRTDLVSITRQAENDFVGAPTGGMDQFASVFGEAGHALLLDMRAESVEAVPFDLEAAGLELLVMDSKAVHHLTDGAYGERRNACEEAARQLGVATLRDVGIENLDAALAMLDSEMLRKRARHVITENDRTLQCVELLRAGRIADTGALLTASHISLRDDFEVSVPEVDLAVEVMLAFGAHGARITGGGFGGCAIGLLAPRQASAAIRAIIAAFAGRGYREPAGFIARAANGTHVLAASPADSVGGSL